MLRGEVTGVRLPVGRVSEDAYGRGLAVLALRCRVGEVEHHAVERGEVEVVRGSSLDDSRVAAIRGAVGVRAAGGTAHARAPDAVVGQVARVPPSAGRLPIRRDPIVPRACDPDGALVRRPDRESVEYGVAAVAPVVRGVERGAAGHAGKPVEVPRGDGAAATEGSVGSREDRCRRVAAGDTETDAAEHSAVAAP